MDVSQDRNCSTTTNFDMEMLASMANTDLLIRFIKDQAVETSTLKSQLSSLNTSAMQMKNCYTMEKKKCDRIEGENLELKLRLQELKEENDILNNNLVNNTSMHEQTVADLENRLASHLADQSNVYKQVIIQGNILKANRLSNRDSLQYYNKAKEFLKKQGETVEYFKLEKKKETENSNQILTKVEVVTMTENTNHVVAKENAATMTENTNHVVAKANVATMTKNTNHVVAKANVATMTENTNHVVAKANVATMTDHTKSSKPKKCCDKSTMLSPMLSSTATRGTNTTFIEKVDVGINYPEPISVEEILRLTILEMPPFITPIEDLPLISRSTQTSCTPSTRDFGVTTSLQNIQRDISYTQHDQSSQFQTLNSQFRVKKEDVSIFDTILNMGSPNGNQSNSHINRKLTSLWQMVGEIIFSIIGHGQIFNQSDDLINENLNQIRNMVEIESQNRNQIDVPSAGINVPTSEQLGLSPVNVIGLLNGTGSNPTNQSITVSPHVHNIEQSTNRQIETILEPVTTSLTNARVNEDLYMNPSLYAESTISPLNSQTDHVFKVPSFAGRKRKMSSKNSTKNRICKRKITAESLASNLNSDQSILTEKAICKSLIKLNLQQMNYLNNIDHEKPDIVEAILNHFKLPKFIEPILDLEFPCDNEGTTYRSEDTNMTTKDSLTESLASNDELESPAPPPPDDSTQSYIPPIIIPLSSNVASRSIVKSILANFDEHKRRTVKRRKYQKLSHSDHQVLTATRSRIEKYIITEWTVSSIDVCCKDVLNIRPSILSKSIIEIAMNTTNEIPSQECTPPTPALPKSHQKIIVLIKRISKHIIGFEDLILFQLEKVLFVLSAERVSIKEAMNLTYLFIGLIDCSDEEKKLPKITLYLYKCLYYFSIKSIPMVYSILMAYPTLLPKFQEGEDINNSILSSPNILQATFLVILINTNLCELSVGENAHYNLKKKELSLFLRAYYHLTLMKPTTDEFVDRLLNRLETENDLENITYALILIAKRNGAEWGEAVIQRKLLPLLKNYLHTISDGNKNDQQITILVTTISSIIKTFPVTKDISSYQQLFYSILDLTTRQTIHQIAIMALLRTSRFGMFDVYQRIRDWEPSFGVDRKLYCMLNTFLYRQNSDYWR